MRQLQIRGASEHNLKNVSLDLPRGRLVVFSGVSGSGKSSLAFDTIHREGQRRFLETLSPYARQFLGGFERPQVESIDGLSPTVCVDQKTVGRSPRSTVGTITEIHDHLRLLYARLGEPRCPKCSRPIAAQSAQQILDRILARHAGQSALVCAPVVRDRKGEHRRTIQELLRDGHSRLRIDGVVVRAQAAPQELERSERHSIEVVCDRLEARAAATSRWIEAIEKASSLSKGIVTIVFLDDAGAAAAPRPGQEDGPALGGDAREPEPQEETFSSRFACPDCGVDLPELEPRLFSFNSPRGQCPTCEGLGETDQIDPELVIADPSLPFSRGGLTGMLSRGDFLAKELDAEGLRALGKRLGFSHRSSWGDLGPEAREAVLHGSGEFEGLVPALEELARQKGNAWVQSCLRSLPCPDCGGARLSPQSRNVFVRETALPAAVAWPARTLREWLGGLSWRPEEAPVAEPITRNLLSRLRYLEDVGLGYLSLDRRADSLSGGEAQRLRLASQVGAGLQGVLFVLDEPSIGLHPRDNLALLKTLRTLRDAGNTVLVVEHDQATLEAADHIVDMGPGAGPLGGEVVAQGTLEQILRQPRSLTGAYLSGRLKVEAPPSRRVPGKLWLEVFEARQNNLKGIDARFPLGLFTVVTGVSGSGKSSLVSDVLRPAILRKLGYQGAVPGKHRSLMGYQHVDKVVEIDQAPIGKSPRSNPATYVKVFDAIRDAFAATPEARARGYGASRFSFNRDGGRCLECDGAGVIVVEMQFLPAVEVVCDACGGRRYNRETLDVRLRARSIHDVLEMTISEAVAFFADHPRIQRPLELLARVGLGYMKLGQPATTLSGGEAQRIKLAAELRRKETGRTLYLLDEPTTGLHFDDVRVLLAALEELVDRGNTVVVIEHNLDVVKVADWVIDLGPDAGSEGGEVVAAGPPEEVCREPRSFTGQALQRHLAPPSSRRGAPERPALAGAGLEGGDSGRDIEVRGARLHNLKGIDVTIPVGSMTVITGVSGSGKTSLAFDTLFAEGERRYLESLSTYARRFLGPRGESEVEEIRGLAPTIAVDQRSSVSNPRSTVATTTEILDYLRLLFARVGAPHCRDCGVALQWTTPSRLADELVERHGGERLLVLAPLCVAEAPTGSLHTALQDRRTSLLKRGFTRVLLGDQELRIDEDPRETVQALTAGLLRLGVEASSGTWSAGSPYHTPLFVVIDRVVLTDELRTRLAGAIEAAFEEGGVAAMKVLGRDLERHSRFPSCPQGHMGFGGELKPSLFSSTSVHGACPRCKGLGVEERVALDALVPAPQHGTLAALHPACQRFLRSSRASTLTMLEGLLRKEKIEPSRPFESLPESVRDAILHGAKGELLRLRLEGGTEIEAAWEGLVPLLERWRQDDALLDAVPAVLFEPRTCSACAGQRLRPEALAVRVGGKSLPQVLAQTIEEAQAFFEGVSLRPRDRAVAAQVLQELRSRLHFLMEVGLEYLTLDRPAGSLSGGEAQRIRLASQLGNRLAGVIYVLDEPTVGLHPRDTRRLLASLRSLQAQGNTIVLVEHDLETIRAADWVIELGPGAGEAGGHIVVAGSPTTLLRSEASLTGRWLRKRAGHLQERADASSRRKRRSPSGWLRLLGARRHNLCGADVSIPLGVFTAVSGVSGSGKSTLVWDVLGDVVERHLAGKPAVTPAVVGVEGLESLTRLVTVDQRPLGRSPRSTPATFTGLWDVVRELYSGLPLAKVRGYSAGRFSFNSGDGRCLACDGQGARHVEMQFLSDVWVPCEVCKGRRYDDATLEVLFREKSVADLLFLDVSAARELFENQPRLRRILDTLEGVGLGYLKLGQGAHTLSGGEAQRVKLAAELTARPGGSTLYLLDEPTTGLHPQDVETLLRVVDALVEGGNSVVVIEHNVEVLEAADWIIDLGPGAGAEGGRVVAEGTPEQVALDPASATGGFLEGLRPARERGSRPARAQREGS